MFTLLQNYDEVMRVYLSAGRVCVDTRELRKGDLFFALPGARVDGHGFLERAAAGGACAAVVSQEYPGPDFGLTLTPVADPLHALQTLAQQVLSLRPCKVVAVTGSVGKTTTKNFLGALLATQYRVSVSPGNRNSQIGLPLTLLNDTDGTEEILVLEMAMTEAGQIRRLTELAPPDLAVITTVALAHAENFESLDDIARAKAEILSHANTQHGVVHRDIGIFGELEKSLRCGLTSFSLTHANADYGLDYSEDTLHIIEDGERHELGMWPVSGEHNRHNLLAAVSAARKLGISWESLRGAIAQLSLPERRLQCTQKKGVTFFNDSYNACEVSVKAALDVVKESHGPQRKVAVLGPMPELGGFSDACHTRVGEHALEKVDHLFCLGLETLPMVEVWRAAGRPVEYFIDRDALVAALREFLSDGDVALVKGANTKRLWEIVEEF